MNLFEVLASHKKWLDGEDGRMANLCGADLRSANLRNADLRGADLRSADLRNADLYNADLRSADLRSADFRGANFHGANLRGADFNSSNLGGADLHSTDLRDADIDNTSLCGTDLRSADLRGAYIGDSDLNDAKMEGCILPDGKKFEDWMSTFQSWLDVPRLRVYEWPDGVDASVRFCLFYPDIALEFELSDADRTRFFVKKNKEVSPELSLDSRMSRVFIDMDLMDDSTAEPGSWICPTPEEIELRRLLDEPHPLLLPFEELREWMLSAGERR